MIKERLMGKKKPQKTKELSVAIAESSSAGEEVVLQHQQETQPQTPRKRGRPRKNIVEETETQEIKQEEAAQVTESQTKKLKITDEEEEEQKAEEEASSASMGGVKKEEAPKEPPPRTRRTRRKNQPRKSSS